MSDTTDTPTDFPAFDEAAVRAEITDYNIERARGVAPASRSQSSEQRPHFPVTMLAPEQRGGIMQRLATIADPGERAREEARLVEPIVRRLADEANVRMGHPNGSAYDQAVAEIVNEQDRLEQESFKIADDLKRTAGYDFVADARGERVPVPRMAIQGPQRAQKEHRAHEIARHILALNGAEGKARLAKAADAEVARLAKLHEDAFVLAEAEKRGRAKILEGRIESLAIVKSRSMLGNG